MNREQMIELAERLENHSVHSRQEAATALRQAAAEIERLKALIEASVPSVARIAELQQAEATLRQMAEQQPVAWKIDLGGTPYVTCHDSSDDPSARPLYAAPVPAVDDEAAHWRNAWKIAREQGVVPAVVPPLPDFITDGGEWLIEWKAEAINLANEFAARCCMYDKAGVVGASDGEMDVLAANRDKAEADLAAHLDKL